MKMNFYDELKIKYDDNEFFNIINKRIGDVYISSCKQLIMFETDSNKRYIFCTSGDCCNEVWIEHINGLKNIWDQRIIEITAKETEDLGEFKEGYLEKILYTFKTKRGYFDIELRNSHNGYYGGELTAFVDCWYLPIVVSPEVTWKKLTKDF